MIEEYFKRQRKENESALAFVKRQQQSELEDYEAMSENDGAKLGRIKLLRMAVLREQLRKGDQPVKREPSVHDEGTRLRSDPPEQITVRASRHTKIH